MMEHHDAAKIVAAVGTDGMDGRDRDEVMEAICVVFVEWALGFQSLHDHVISMASEAGWQK